MPTLQPDEARINDAVAGLRDAHERRVSRIPQAPTVPQFRTTPAGEVFDAQGRLVFRSPLVGQGR